MSDFQLPAALRNRPLWQYGAIGAAALALAWYVRRSMASGPDVGVGEATEADTVVVQAPRTTPGSVPVPVYVSVPQSENTPAPSRTPEPVGSPEPPISVQPVQPPRPSTPAPAPVPAPNQPTAPPVKPNPNDPRLTRSYPGYPEGLPADWELRAFKGLYIEPSQVEGGGKGTAFNQRNKLAHAVQGNVTPWIGPENTGRGYNNPGDYPSQDRINRVRVAFGLFPLTREELNAISALVSRANLDNPPDSLINQIFNTYNKPYRVGIYGRARESGSVPYYG